MKKFKFMLIAAIAALPLLQSCNDSDGDYPSIAKLVTTVPLSNGDYYFRLDNQKTIYPSDKSRIGAYEAKEGQRTIIQFNLLKDPATGYDYNAALYAIDDVLTKEPKVVTTQEELTEIGDDNIHIQQAWISGGYLNIRFTYLTRDNSTVEHYLNLIKNEVTVPAESLEDYTSMEFRHNGHNDLTGYSVYGYVSFKLGDFDPAATGKKGLHIRTKDIYGNIKYIAIEPEATE